MKRLEALRMPPRPGLLERAQGRLVSPQAQQRLATAGQSCALHWVNVARQTRELVERHMENFRNEVVPRLEGLERGVIHNDANPDNVLSNRRDQAVTGFIDFGDVLDYLARDLSTRVGLVELHTGGKTVLQYLLKPLYKSQDAFREP